MSTDESIDAAEALCGRGSLPGPAGTDHGGRAKAPVADGLHAARLRRTIETEIVPRLLAARGRLAPVAGHSLPVPADVPTASRHVESADCVELQRLLLAHESPVAGAFVEALINQGIARDEIYMDLLAPVARGFGQLWESDAADFTQITVALGRMQLLLHELGRDSSDLAELGQGLRSVLLMAMPGEQHTFGLLVIGDCFRRHGWNVCCEFPRTTREALELASRNHFDIVGLSLARDQRVEDMAALLPILRRSSLNPALRVLVGGPLFLRQPGTAAEIGADATAETGEQAVSEAKRLVEQLTEMH